MGSSLSLRSFQLPLSDLSLSVSFSSENGPKSRHYPVHRCGQSEERWVKGAIFTFSSSFLPFLTFLLLRIACMVRDPSLELATPLSFSLSSSSSQFYSAERFLHRTVRGRRSIHVFHILEKLNFRQKRDRAKS